MILARDTTAPRRSAAYLEWVRTLPCACCGRSGAQAAHTGPHGLGQKASDFTALPLCAWHHTGGNDSYHRLGEKVWAARWKLEVAPLVARLNRVYGLVHPGRTQAGDAPEGGRWCREEEDEVRGLA